MPKSPSKIVSNFYEKLYSTCPEKYINLTELTVVSFGEKTNEKPSFHVKFSCCTSRTCTKNEIPPVYGGKNSRHLFAFSPSDTQKIRNF
jgi:hypothetical protein